MDNFTKVNDLYTKYGLTRPQNIDHNPPVDNLVDTKTILSQVEHGNVPYPFVSDLRFRPNLTMHIGEGTYGHVYALGAIKETAVKFQLHSSGSGIEFTPGNGTMDVVMNSFDKEVEFQLQASAAGIAPVVYNAWTSEYATIWGDGYSDVHDVLIMDRLEETIFEKCKHLRKYDGGGFQTVLGVIEKMHSVNIFHGDLHSANIMADYYGDPYIIDFGKSKIMPEGDEAKTWCILHDLNLLFATLPNKSYLKKLVKQKAFIVGGSETRALGMDFDFTIHDN